MGDGGVGEKLGEFIKGGEVGCGLSGVDGNMYEGNENFDKEGWVVLGFKGDEGEGGDGYSCSGSL